MALPTLPDESGRLAPVARQTALARYVGGHAIGGAVLAGGTALAFTWRSLPHMAHQYGVLAVLAGVAAVLGSGAALGAWLAFLSRGGLLAATRSAWGPVVMLGVVAGAGAGAWAGWALAGGMWSLGGALAGCAAALSVATAAWSRWQHRY